MEVFFVFSEVYHKNLNRFPEKKHDWNLVKPHGEMFIQQYASLVPVMVTEIQRITGKDFVEGKIPVYIVGWEGPSFSNPLTLNARKDMLLMFTTLCHELFHRIFKGEGPSFELEEKINYHVKLVMANMKIKADEQIEVMRERARKKYNIANPKKE